MVNPIDEPLPCRLFCFPHAGGNASAFRGWTAQPGLSGVIVHPVHLPGRQARFRDPAPVRMAPLVEIVLADLEPWLHEPFALFGHSMGALLAFEVARTLRRRGLPSPLRLCVSSHSAPRLRRLGAPLHRLPDARLLSLLGLAPGAGQSAAQHRELMALMLPTLRADLEVCETYHPAPELPLALPLAAFGGAWDPGVTRAGLAAWGDETTAGFVVRQFPGDHHYLARAAPAVCTILGQFLAIQETPSGARAGDLHPIHMGDLR
jgi:medium-chain acyl-[acyl-carrier-protein] hydrolase